METEHTFTLPRGYVDDHRRVHTTGTMRLATARDEVEILRDAAVRQNGASLSVLLLSRVVTSIGPIDDVTPDLVQNLFAADFDHLQRLYERLNTDADLVGAVTCPGCGQKFEVDLRDVEDASPGG
jgi:hypothetical protein